MQVVFELPTAGRKRQSVQKAHLAILHSGQLSSSHHFPAPFAQSIVVAAVLRKSYELVEVVKANRFVLFSERGIGKVGQVSTISQDALRFLDEPFRDSRFA
jgi:hypothetical protein